MASIKVKFRPSTNENKEGRIYYQIIQNRVIRQLKTYYRLFMHEWDKEENSIIVAGSSRESHLQSIQERIDWDIKRLQSIINQLENKRVKYTVDDIISIFQKQANEQSLFNFMQGVIAQLQQMGKQRTSETYRCTLKSFMHFREDKDVLLEDIDSDLMLMYEAYLRGRGLMRNSTSFYMRILRMAYLKKKDLSNGILSYRRRKTGQQLFILWEDCMENIVDQYSSFSSPYLLSIIKEPTGNTRKQYHNALTLINHNLKAIGKELGLTLPLTKYVARHSWASIARDEGIPISVISEGMGHDSEMTTQIYLASLDTAVVDKANNMILNLL